MLGVDGVSDFKALHSRKPDDKIAKYRFCPRFHVSVGCFYAAVQRLRAALVNSDIKLTVPTGYSINGADWKAYQTFVPGAFLYKLFGDHGADLFSANVRDYLGSRDSDANINSGIKETATGTPENFWVYNNGVTALVNSLTVRKLASGQ
ncbi:AIPR family protein [Bradyrhizobium diazoefficiens]|nr:AIPR family protein [Bradyrhizobium diazoefficiens]